MRGERVLYSAGVPADYFIMILEGHVQVACGREGLIFEAGPFCFFGQAALAAPAGARQSGGGGGRLSLATLDSSIGLAALSAASLAPVSQVSRAKESLELAAGIKSNGHEAQPTGSGVDVLQPQAPIGRLKRNDSRALLSSLEQQLVVGTSKSAAAPTSSNQAPPHTSFFVPDYTVEVITSTSYLKITRQDYLAALRATVVERSTTGINNAPDTSTGDSNLSLDENEERRAPKQPPPSRYKWSKETPVGGSRGELSTHKNLATKNCAEVGQEDTNKPA